MRHAWSGCKMFFLVALVLFLNYNRSMKSILMEGK